MRPAVFFVQSALCVMAASAFYPFKPAWLEEKQAKENALFTTKHKNAPAKGDASAGITVEIEHRAVNTLTSSAEGPSREATRLSSKYGGPRIGKSITNEAVVKRDNRYKIMEAAAPKQPLTAGIDQDGTDFAYFVKVEFGSKRKALHMLLDTGAGSSWVMGSSCSEVTCLKHDTFGPGDSDTFHATNKPFSVSYGSGTVEGELAEDTIAVAGVGFGFKFGVASSTSNEFEKFPFDGILGLSMTRGPNDNFLDKMIETGKLEKNIFAVALNRASDGTNTGEIKFGATNPDKFSGNFTYTALGSQDGEWAIPIDDIAFDGSKAQVGGVLAYIDTGTSFIFGPKDKVQKVHSIIPGAKSADGQVYRVPCDTNKPLTFSFSGVDHQVSPQDWIAPKNDAGECTSNVYGYEIAKGSWLIGDTFLMNVYTVFDKDEKRIGFASLAGSDSESSSSGHKQPTKTSMSGSATTSALGATAGSDEAQQSEGLDGYETPASGDSTATSSKPKGTATSAATGGARFRGWLPIAAILLLVAV